MQDINVLVAPESQSSRVVEFTTSDGVKLSGRRYGEINENPVVLLAHMFPVDQQGWGKFPEQLTESGYSAFTFNFRGYKPSQGSKKISELGLDLAAAVQYLLSQGARGIVIVGASMGGTAAIQYVAHQDLLGVIAISPPTEFRGLNALRDIALVETSVHLMVSETDKAAHREAAILFHAPHQAGWAIEVFRSGGHGTDLLNGQYGSLVVERLIEVISGFIT